MTTSTINVSAREVEGALRSVGLSHYTGHSGTVASVVNAHGDNADALVNYARSRGVSVPQSQAEEFLRALLGSATSEEQAAQAEVDESFNEFRARVAERLMQVTRSLTSDSRIIGQVEDTLVEVGLVDPEPEPEPEPEVEAEAGDLASTIEAAVQRAVAPLVEFARRHGYRG